MNKKGPIIVIEDDQDDQEILGEIFEKLGYENKVIFFKNGNDTLEFLNKSDIHPFLILSDINMPVINGFELRNKIYTNELHQTKCIPYLCAPSILATSSMVNSYSLIASSRKIMPR